MLTPGSPARGDSGVFSLPNLLPSKIFRRNDFFFPLFSSCATTLSRKDKDDREGGRYWYTRGWNLKAVAALIAGGVFSMLFQLSPTFANFSFFIGAIGSGLAYYAITGAERKAA